jgi:hypothetical protein
MDRDRFDALARLFATEKSRRGALGTFLGLAVFGGGADALAKNNGGRHKRRGKNQDQKKRKQKQRRARQQAAPANCFKGTNCTPGPNANLSSCDFEETSALAGQNLKSANLSKANLHDADASGANFSSANLGGACLVDADFSGATFSSTNLSNAVFCRTRMPDGTIANAGCTKGTRCCPTCVPINEEGCNLGGTCCGGGVCSSSGNGNGNGPGICTCPSGTILCPNGTCRGCCAASDCGERGDRCNANGQCRCGSGPACTGDEVCSSGMCVVPVSPGKLNGWTIVQGEVVFANGPGTPPVGTGAVQISTVSATRSTLANTSYAGFPIANLTSLRYSTYMQHGSTTGVVVPAIKLPVRYNNNTTFTTLIFEPTYFSGGPPVTLNTWQTWDLLSANARWWSSQPLPNGICSFNCYRSWADILAAIPDAKITSPGAILIETGSGTPGAIGNVDKLEINGTIFDFEPNP